MFFILCLPFFIALIIVRFRIKNSVYRFYTNLAIGICVFMISLIGITQLVIYGYRSQVAIPAECRQLVYKIKNKNLTDVEKIEFEDQKNELVNEVLTFNDSMSYWYWGLGRVNLNDFPELTENNTP